MGTIVIYCVVVQMSQAAIFLFHPNRFGRGKILTRPLIRLLRLPENDYLVRNFVRASQVFVLLIWLSVMVFTHAMSRDKRMFIYFTLVTALYLDDYLTGDDDKWKKFKDAVRNKIKWKMELPQPARERIN